MTARPGATSRQHCILVERPDDLEAWREQARALAAAGVAPEHVIWSLQSSGAADLFGGAAAPAACLSSLAAPLAVRANEAFLGLAQVVIRHRDAARFALLYRLLWRLQGDRRLMEKPADPDVHRAIAMGRQVRRDIHKMRAFARFRAVTEPDGGERYIAWFEPEHHVVRANARFFLDRFASQRWSILTPDLCLHWDGESLVEAPGADPRDAPREDATEDLWQRYYASIFNPARLKVGMMVKEMPRRYWKNLPEAQLIPQLIAGAQAREAAMVAQGADPFPAAPPGTLEEIAQGIAACRRCPIGCNGTRAVPGEGPAQARLLIVGEQPGDSEERAGRPFVGPAGQLLDRHLQQAGLDRASIRLTNAVKHFRFEPRGKRRIHQTPTAGQIDRCRWWLEAERRLVKPDMVLALGASAGRALLGRAPRLADERGTAMRLADGAGLWLTVDPSYLLRLDGAARDREEARFQDDLARLRIMLEEPAATP
ncbi:putative uracil-DNA glycosylase [Sphingobium sp. SYK-6]|uniref:UdgX family uracil-DNA binding protein n=1 Tax=Sphingobium sp. (strain NBRC 103272 / SYK-6) TaxID=627192 RepID=UPI0002277155|nr:UdgX family uracil-DNA binding protein [Sphingobium sp. SYK-6]BAK67520.1 putative uracil-DNA glycosylase [Sphingobium sp. SYK-6]